MNSTLRIGTALGAALLAATLGGCARKAPQSASAVMSKQDIANIGLASRAQTALMAGNTAEAVSLAERAVDVTPTDAAFRALLGNSYFAAGRFASAEAAYRDSLTIQSNQPQVVLKMALVSIAQGKNGQALAFLDAARNLLDPADYGLAQALAGRPQEAADMLRRAAEQVGADSRVRQNLALALALSGDWVGARSVASQDVPADQIDERIQSWMAMARPARASDQVAALTGIAPAASDPGQPLRLALKDGNTRLAVAAPLTVQLPAAVEAVPALPAIQSAEAALAVEPLYPDALAPRAATTSPRPALSPRAAALTDARILYRHAARQNPQHSRSVVQLGAYANRSALMAAWQRSAHKFANLRSYTPVAARYDGARGTFFRLSVRGFATAGQATAMCSGLRRAGADCFVRDGAADARVQFASR